MPDSEEAAWLRENWNADRLGRYEGVWIAVRGREVVASGPDLEALNRSVDALPISDPEPLNAFVVLGPLQV